MIDLSRVEKYYVACGYTDMRRGIDGLAAIVSQQFGAPLRTACFCFAGGGQTGSKRCISQGMLYKRLNNGAFQWPRSEQELRLLDKRSFRWLMEGLKPEQPKAIQLKKETEICARSSSE